MILQVFHLGPLCGILKSNGVSVRKLETRLKERKDFLRDASLRKINIYDRTKCHLLRWKRKGCIIDSLSSRLTRQSQNPFPPITICQLKVDGLQMWPPTILLSPECTCCSFYQEMESVSSPLESGLDLGFFNQYNVTEMTLFQFQPSLSRKCFHEITTLSRTPSEAQWRDLMKENSDNVANSPPPPAATWRQLHEWHQATVENLATHPSESEERPATAVSALRWCAIQ